MKRPMGYRTIRCPHCGGKVKVLFRTLHRLKVEVEKIGSSLFPPKKERRGDHRGEEFHSSEAKDD